jgi:hypothetical protein
MLKRVVAVCLASLIWMSLSAVSIFACACCAEPGTYFLSTGRPSTYSLDVIREIEFSKPADLYMTEAGFDMVKGLDPVKAEYESDAWTATSGFDLTASFTGKLWTFNLKTPKGKSATLVLPVPAQMVTYKVDIHDQEDRPNGPMLYKEFRFKGSLSSAAGFARSGFVRGTTYFLVFQGRGNGCDNASDFTHWRLEINGPRADYAFFGKLDSKSAKKRDIEQPLWSAGMTLTERH